MLDVDRPGTDAPAQLGALGRRARAALLPRRLRRHRFLELGLFLVIALAAISSQSGSAYSTSLVIRWLYLSIAVVGFWLTFGVAGQFAFCQAAFVGVGAYTSARVIESGGSFLVGVLAAVLVVSLLAGVFMLLVRNANQFYFAIATLGLTEIFLTTVQQWEWFGGATGFRSGIPKPELLGHEFRTPEDLAYLALGFLVLAIAGLVFIERSPLYRNAITQRDLYDIAPLLGVPVERTRMTAFVGSAYVGAAGAFFASWQGFLGSDSFGVELSLGIFVMLILGGTGSVWGGVIGAAFYVWLPEWLRSFDQYKELTYGVVLLVAIILLPDGIVGIVSRVRHLAGAALGRRRPSPAKSDPRPPEEAVP